MKLWRAKKLKKIKLAVVVSLVLASGLASADGLKVFGRAISRFPGLKTTD